MPATPLSLKSDFAILDVKTGRSKLRKALQKGGKIKVVLHATIDGEHNRDDGISQEFALAVTSLRVRAA